MGERINKFKKLIKSIFISITKHKVILINSIISAVFGIIMVYLSSTNDFYDYCEKLFSSFLMATLFALPATYVSEKFNSVTKYLIQVAASLIGAAINYCLLEFVESDSYCAMYLLGIVFAVICVTITIFAPKNNTKAYYANLVKNFLFTGLLCFVGILGSFLLIYAFSNLIVEIDNIDDLMLTFSIIWGIVVYVNLFVFYIFEKREEPSGKAFKIIFLFILFPIYCILLLILYIYLFKALFTLSLPNGQINWFVSFASVFYLVFYFIFKEYEEIKIVKVFYKFGSFVLIPLICVQWPAYFIRLSSYGFTGWRYSSLIYNIFTVIFIVFTFVKNGKYTKYAIPVLGGFILLTSVTPLNLIDVAYRSQYGRLVKVLEKYDMMENGGLKEHFPAIENIITDDDRADLVSAYNYVKFTSDHEKPGWLKKSGDTKDVLNVNEKKESDDIINFEMEYNSSAGGIIDIKGYSTIQKGKETVGIYFSDEDAECKRVIFPHTQFDMSDIFLELINSNSGAGYLYCQIDDNTMAYLYNIAYRYDKTKKGFTYYEFDYYLMKK